MIDLPDLEGLNVADIELLLKKEENETVDIYLPKTTQQYFNEPIDIAWDYGFAAYSAQELSGKGTILEYEFVQPPEFESYRFSLRFTDAADLAETLYSISCLYGFNGGDEDEDSETEDDGNYVFEPTLEDVSQFFYEVENGKIEPVCPDIVKIYYEFMPPEDDDED